MDRIVNKGDIRVRVDVRGGANDLLAPGEGGTYGIVDNVNELSETCIIYRDGQRILAGNFVVEDDGSEEQEAEEQVEAEDSEQDDQEQVEEESDENDESDEDEQEVEQDEQQSEEESSDENSEPSLDELDYRELQELAGDYEDVQGNLPKDELLEELKAKS
jgi:Mg-chelatase subunit ChlI